jgi:hypothetical protein
MTNKPRLNQRASFEINSLNHDHLGLIKLMIDFDK